MKYNAFNCLVSIHIHIRLLSYCLLNFGLLLFLLRLHQMYVSCPLFWRSFKTRTEIAIKMTKRHWELKLICAIFMFHSPYRTLLRYSTLMCVCIWIVCFFLVETYLIFDQYMKGKKILLFCLFIYVSVHIYCRRFVSSNNNIHVYEIRFNVITKYAIASFLLVNDQ